MRAIPVLLTAVSVLALPAAAQAQSLELFDFPNFQGASVRVEREVANLGPGAFDDMTTSVAIESGSWEMCDGANFTGQCVVVDEDTWDLQSLGMNNRISSIRPAQYAAAPFPTQPGAQYPGTQYPGAQPQFQQPPMLVLYENTNFRGRSATFYADADNLRFEGFDDRARSVDVTGDWLLCEGQNLGGRCERISSDIPNLSSIAMANSISSVAPDTLGGPIYNPQPGPLPPQQGARMLAGTDAAFFPAPYIQPNRLNACLRGDARSCESEVDIFCRAQSGGWREGAYYSIDSRNYALTDVLCVR